MSSWWKCLCATCSSLRIACMQCGSGSDGQTDNLRMYHLSTLVPVIVCRCVYIYTPSSRALCRARPRHLHLHELHEESYLLWCHSYQLQTGHFWHDATSREESSLPTNRSGFYRLKRCLFLLLFFFSLWLQTVFSLGQKSFLRSGG